jgi:acetyl esterase/lipase
MSSPESQQIRATFVNDREMVHVPVEIQRREWEEAAALAVLPPNTTVRPISAAGVSCEMVCCSCRELDHLMFYLHGGGFTSGSCRTHRDLAARLSLVCGLPVLVVDYRLAPENPFPAGLEDAVKVYRWMIHKGTLPDHIIVGGDSSGGGLVMSMLGTLHAAGDPLPTAGVLMSPWLDLALTGESLHSRAALDPLVSQEGLRACIKDYVGDRDPQNPLISPLFADLHGLPPLLVQVGDHEVLLSDSESLCRRAKAVGVEITLEVWPEMWHVWHAFAAQVPEAQAAIDRIGEYVRRQFNLSL